MKEETVITISGLAGVGTTTLAEGLQKITGYGLYSAGPQFRRIANENSLDINRTSEFPIEFHRTVDERMLDVMRSGMSVIVEGWLQGYVARVNDIVSERILVVCDESVRFERISKREKIDFSEAKKVTELRERENRQMFYDLYQISNFQDLAYYTFVLDSGKMTAGEMLIFTLGRLGLLTGN
ncbi:hypothetical protein COX94_01000 [Candidatus Nomurabacteria bacterium CG_4_10_14_0_2_um_filter_33_9]|uniref:(d)CMP kinase n=1 Tax=Candidatus Nomurabacteria bacterium CG_4_10_14_0_2_um_filter_33_9 TaxID=1974728 RepID=A0A2J0ME99_9BACT|nr:MAG: hypothetical protein COX94_01000 [Candidatus Nomurabacteria bacterium CG_4_10_14_0_2_um_filter_33_9]